MSRYTIKLSEMGTVAEVQAKLFDDFDYEIYDESHRDTLEQRFIRNYYFYEIGQATVQEFIFYLQDYFISNMPYYNHLYQAAEKLKPYENSGYIVTKERNLESLLTNNTDFNLTLDENNNVIIKDVKDSKTRKDIDLKDVINGKVANIIDMLEKENKVSNKDETGTDSVVDRLSNTKDSTKNIDLFKNEQGKESNTKDSNGNVLEKGDNTKDKNETDINKLDTKNTRDLKDVIDGTVKETQTTDENGNVITSDNGTSTTMTGVGTQNIKTNKYDLPDSNQTSGGFLTGVENTENGKRDDSESINTTADNNQTTKNNSKNVNDNISKQQQSQTGTESQTGTVTNTKTGKDKDLFNKTTTNTSKDVLSKDSTVSENTTGTDTLKETTVGDKETTNTKDLNTKQTVDNSVDKKGTNTTDENKTVLKTGNELGSLIDNFNSENDSTKKQNILKEIVNVLDRNDTEKSVTKISGLNSNMADDFVKYKNALLDVDKLVIQNARNLFMLVY